MTFSLLPHESADEENQGDNSQGHLKTHHNFVVEWKHPNRHKHISIRLHFPCGSLQREEAEAVNDYDDREYAGKDSDCCPSVRTWRSAHNISKPQITPIALTTKITLHTKGTGKNGSTVADGDRLWNSPKATSGARTLRDRVPIISL